MAELLVRVIDKYEGVDPLFLSKSTMRGDVIEVRPDGWPWSLRERTSPQWIIVKVDASMAKCAALIAAEPGDVKQNPYLRIRAFHLDLDALAGLGYAIPSEVAAKDSQANQLSRETETVEIAETEMDTLTVEKSKIEDPAVIG